MAASSRRSSGSVLTGKSPFRQLLSRSGPFIHSARITSDAPPVPSSFASSSSYYSSAASVDYFARRRPSSPTRVSLNALSSQPPRQSIRFRTDGSTSPRRSITASAARNQVVRRSHGMIQIQVQKKTCLCSPTSHPGSFRCALHKNNFSSENRSTTYSPSRLNMRRSAMTNSLVRIGTVEGDLVKRALSALIRPSSHQQRRRAGFQPKQSRLSVMSKASDSL